MAEVRFADMQGRVALISGAASGIGEACARQFAAQGCRLVLLDRNGERLQTLVDELVSGKSGPVSSLVGDVTDEAVNRAAVARCQSDFGRIDYAVNSAGIAGAPATLDETSLAEWQRVIAINLTGVFLGLKHQLRAMKAAGRGSVVSIASGAGLIGTPHLGPYCASKHAVLGLTKTAAMEVARSGIRVNAVLPGSTRTPLLEDSMRQGPELEQMILNSIPCGRLGNADEIAAAVLWLCSEQASYVNGHSLVVDGATVCR
ncbi:MAG TPA: SDR family NAD(P)-dependent oxidoreductase [Spongiibacteraceae bacterium]|jgi:NAD(P)-dependent dehydrogenase (short-subunit alcohol dehydrogenase family)|nr:SDR family NAD(P)-dependent oxidoreductase [Spongiibacteraceae bacterium]HUH37480.1 SDR family NAD(P)-dependent oxidoreductase [Spongiibacteraceae bacterium]